MKPHEIWINNFCQELTESGVKFDVEFKIEDLIIIMTHTKELNMKSIVESVFKRHKIKNSYLSLSGADTWIIDENNVWHIVSYPNKLCIQWENVSY